MIKLQFGERSKVTYNNGILQKSVVEAGSMGVAIFLDKSPVVMDMAWSPAVKRMVDVESAEFFAKHSKELQTPRRRYYFLVARFDVEALQDGSKQIIPNTFRIEYLDLGSGTYKDFCEATIALPQFNGAFLTRVEKPLEGKTINYIKPYPTMFPLPAEDAAKVTAIQNDPTEVQRLWEEFRKCVGAISCAAYEQMLNGGAPQTMNVQTSGYKQQAPQPQPVVQQPAQPQAAQQAPTAQPAPQPQQSQQTAAFGEDPFVNPGAVPF